MKIEAAQSWRGGVCDRFVSIADARDACDDLVIEKGTPDDYRELARFHYRGGRPGVVTSVLCMRRSSPSVIGRYLARDSESELIGVLVRSLPALACRMRDVAMGGRYRGLGQREAAIMLNREVRTISRVVIDPRYRGLGLAVNLVRFALENPEERDPPLRFTEALAAMGRVSPFFERAGMVRYERPVRQDHARLIDALRYVGLEPCSLAPLANARAHVESLHSSTFGWIERELRRWHRAAFRTPRRSLDAIGLDQLLGAARSELLSQPVYYAYRH
jgi:GNAT superfamily N-acetyltransferase